MLRGPAVAVKQRASRSDAHPKCAGTRVRGPGRGRTCARNRQHPPHERWKKSFCTRQNGVSSVSTKYHHNCLPFYSSFVNTLRRLGRLRVLMTRAKRHFPSNGGVLHSSVRPTDFGRTEPILSRQENCRAEVLLKRASERPNQTEILVRFGQIRSRFQRSTSAFVIEILQILKVQ